MLFFMLSYLFYFRCKIIGRFGKPPQLWEVATRLLCTHYTHKSLWVISDLYLLVCIFQHFDCRKNSQRNENLKILKEIRCIIVIDMINDWIKYWTFSYSSCTLLAVCEFARLTFSNFKVALTFKYSSDTFPVFSLF